MKPYAVLPLVGMLMNLPGCVPASEHARDVAAGRDVQSKMTLGTVQREIRVGMSGADVIGILVSRIRSSS